MASIAPTLTGTIAPQRTRLGAALIEVRQVEEQALEIVERKAALVEQHIVVRGARAPD